MDALHLATMRFHAAAEAEVAQLVGAWARPAAMRAAKPAVLAAARWWAPIACGGLTLRLRQVALLSLPVLVIGA